MRHQNKGSNKKNHNKSMQHTIKYVYLGLMLILIIFTLFFMKYYFKIENNKCITYSEFLSTPMKVEEGNGKDYLALGDSISVGTGLSNKEKAFTSLLSAALNNSKYMNEAVGGLTSEGLLRKLVDKELRNEIKEAEIITITIGGNDLIEAMKKSFAVLKKDNKLSLEQFYLKYNDIKTFFLLKDIMDNQKVKKIFHNSYETFGKNLNEILSTINQLNPKVMIIIQTVYNPFDGNEGFQLIAQYVDQYLKKLNEIINKVSLKRCFIVDTYKEFKDCGGKYTRIANFDIHPNEDGHQKIFELVKAIIIDYNISIKIYE